MEVHTPTHPIFCVLFHMSKIIPHNLKRPMQCNSAVLHYGIRIVNQCHNLKANVHVVMTMHIHPPPPPLTCISTLLPVTCISTLLLPLYAYPPSSPLQAYLPPYMHIHPPPPYMQHLIILSYNMCAYRVDEIHDTCMWQMCTVVSKLINNCKTACSFSCQLIQLHV